MECGGGGGGGVWGRTGDFRKGAEDVFEDGEEDEEEDDHEGEEKPADCFGEDERPFRQGEPALQPERRLVEDG